MHAKHATARTPTQSKPLAPTEIYISAAFEIETLFDLALQNQYISLFRVGSDQIDQSRSAINSVYPNFMSISSIASVYPNGMIVLSGSDSMLYDALCGNGVSGMSCPRCHHFYRLVFDLRTISGWHTFDTERV
ncbi:hypothetical protein E4T56_gene3314 [Termitomyces sp. T112]|nr:hypothetical protein E4T56_gene3314 [Termitomyces sp. T112]